MKVAIVHDWCVGYGGAEKVLELIIDCFPAADIFCLIDVVPNEQREFLRDKIPKTSFLQYIPFSNRLYGKLAFLVPLAIKQFDLSGYDLIISSSHCVALGVITDPHQVHVCYCHSPMRDAEGNYHEHLKEMKLRRGAKSWFSRWRLHRMRNWRVRSGNYVDQFIASSSYARAKIKKFYRRESSLVFPPVDTSMFKLDSNKQDYYVAASGVVNLKRLDFVIEAFNAMPDKRLVVVGDGPELAKMKMNAAANIEFVGFQPAQAECSYLARARALIFPSEEDFGTLSVEAQACGTPVIAFGAGAALESIVGFGTAEARNKPPTGIFFHEPNASSLRACVEKFESKIDQFAPAEISKHAQRFKTKSFKKALCEEVVTAMMKRSCGRNTSDLENSIS